MRRSRESSAIRATRGAWLPKAILGYVTVRDNQAYFNGQPLGGDRRAALIEACRTAGAGKVQDGKK